MRFAKPGRAEAVINAAVALVKARRSLKEKRYAELVAAVREWTTVVKKPRQNQKVGLYGSKIVVRHRRPRV